MDNFYNGKKLFFLLYRRSTFGNEFRKPVWFDDCESDDELSERKGFQIFTNPMEMQKYFEQQMIEQMQEILKSVEIFDSGNSVLVLGND